MPFRRSRAHRLFATSGWGSIGPLKLAVDCQPDATHGVHAPSAPLNVAAEEVDDAWTITWDPPADDGGAAIIGYSVVVFVDGSPEASSGNLGNVTTWSYGFPEFQHVEIEVRVRATNGSYLSPYSIGATFTPGGPEPTTTTTTTPGPEPTTTTTTTPDPGGRVTVLEDTFTGSSPFNMHMPEVGAWNIGSDADLTGDGRLLFPQSIGGSINSADASNGAFEADFDFEFDEDFTTNMTIVFNEDGGNDLSWKLILTGNVLTLVEYASAVDTPRGSFNFPDGTTAAAITINTEGDGGNTINVYVGGNLEITYNVTDRPGKAEAAITIFHDINAFNVYLTYAKVTQLP